MTLALRLLVGFNTNGKYYCRMLPRIKTIWLMSAPIFYSPSKSFFLLFQRLPRARRLNGYRRRMDFSIGIFSIYFFNYTIASRIGFFLLFRNSRIFVLLSIVRIFLYLFSNIVIALTYNFRDILRTIVRKSNIFLYFSSIFRLRHGNCVSCNLYAA